MSCSCLYVGLGIDEGLNVLMYLYGADTCPRPCNINAHTDFTRVRINSGLVDSLDRDISHRVYINALPNPCASDGIHVIGSDGPGNRKACTAGALYHIRFDDFGCH